LEGDSSGSRAITVMAFPSRNHEVEIELEAAASTLSPTDEVTILVDRIVAIDTTTTIGRQKIDQLIDRAEARAVDPRPALSIALDQVGALQLFQMKRQRRGREAENISNGSRRQSLGSCLNQHPEHIQASLMG
jgi:hypothetical protein